MKPGAKVKGLDCDEVLEGFLFLGSARAASQPDLLRDALGITHIVCLAGKTAFPDRFEYVKFHFKDSDDVELFPDVLELFDHLAHLESENKNRNSITEKKSDDSQEVPRPKLKGNGRGKENKVLVHCMGGVSRSPSIVCGFLMRRNHWTYDEALAYVRQKRKASRPNQNFELQLREYEKTLFSGIESH